MRGHPGMGVGVCLLVSTLLLVPPARATIIFTANAVSGIGSPLSLEADLTISGNSLTLVLKNNSVDPSQGPNDLLGSFYFDIVNGASVRPTLTYQSAVGDVWLTNKNGPDTLQTANANLKAVAAGDNTWQFKVMNTAFNPFLGFGVGTVGNMNLAPNNFMGNIVDGFDYGIYTGDVTTSNLDGKLLVKGPITYTFTGVSGFTEADIANKFAFGMGTAPDSLITPEPIGLSTLTALAPLILVQRRRAKSA